MSFVGFSDSYEDENEDESKDELAPAMEESHSHKRAPVLSLHAASDMKIVVISPASFEETDKLAGHLKNRRPVIVNFSNAPKETAQRIIDFLSGAVFALNGSTFKVTTETFLFNPSNVSVYSEDQLYSLREKLPLKWDQEGMRNAFAQKG